MFTEDIHLPIFIIQTCIVLIGTISNVVSFVVWTKGKVCRTLPIALYFRILAAVDTFILLVPGIELLLYVSPWNINLRYLNQVTCRLYPGLTHSDIRVSSWIISSFSIERTLYVYFPTKFRVSHNSARTIIITTCLVIASLLMDLPLFIRSEFVTVMWVNYTFANDTFISSPVVTQPATWTTTSSDIHPFDNESVTVSNDTWNNVQPNETFSNLTQGVNEPVHYTVSFNCAGNINNADITLDVVTKFLITFIILVGCNILILIQLRRQHQFTLKMGDQRVNEVRQARYRNAIYQMVGISFFHCISTAPWALLASCRIFGCATTGRLFNEFLLMFNSLAYLNSAINVILYCFIGNNFRRDARSLFCFNTIKGPEGPQLNDNVPKV